MTWTSRLLMAAACAAASASAAAPALAQHRSFDHGGLPAGWRAGATGGKAADWRVGADRDALSPPNALAIERLNDRSAGNFNLFWFPAAAFADGAVEVNVRADSGDIDRGGGLIWRARDERNYYLARYNPLERNLRLYTVRDGVRRMLADAPGLTVGSGQWFALKVVQRGARIEIALNGSKLIEFTDDAFTAAGGVGVWSKADAISAFDDFRVRAAQ